MNRLYLDNAATSWPKPPEVLRAVGLFMDSCGATAGRGCYRSAQTAGQWVDRARRSVGRLIGAYSPECVAFCSSGTHALNAALLGLLGPGDHVITTQAEHNSVLRPLSHLQRAGGIVVDHVAIDRCGLADVDDAHRLVGPKTAMIVVGHASNVTGVVQDLRRWKDLACHCRVPLLVDASQTLGYLPIDMQAHGIDILAAAGHKGLQALPGTGLLVLAPALHSKLKPLLTGGTGQSSELLEGGNGWPNSVEVGCANLPGIVSMAVAADLLLDVRDRLTDSASTSWKASLDRLTEGLLKIPSVNLIGYSEAASGPRIPVVSVTVDGWDVHDLAAILDESFGIEVRSGLHCAALVHQAIGTDPSGTLRISLGHHTLASDIDRLLVALNQITTGGQA